METEQGGADNEQIRESGDGESGAGEEGIHNDQKRTSLVMMKLTCEASKQPSQSTIAAWSCAPNPGLAWQVGPALSQNTI